MDWSSDWEAAFDAARRRQLRVLLCASFVLHLLVATALAFVPEPAPAPLGQVISIDLMSLPGPPAPRPAARPKPRPAKPEKVVLPKRPPALPAKPKAVKPVTRPPRPKEMEYGEALAQLRSELGEKEPEVAQTDVEAPEPGEGKGGPTAQQGGLGAPASDEMLAWQAATKRHVRERYVTPPEFLNRSLVTVLRVVLSADGAVLGMPEVARSSGDPFWDDNAVRALMRASPLPAPPEAGTWTFVFPSEDR